MATYNVAVGDQEVNLLVGYQDENEVSEVVFDFSAWNTAYGAGTIALSVQRSQDEWPYAVTMTVAGTNATWEISETDTAFKGTGYAQLTYTVSDVIKKSAIYRFTVYESLGANGSIVTPIQIKALFTDVEQLKLDVGTMSNLTTTEQGSLVGAINEVDGHADTNTTNITTNTTAIGTLADLTTTAKTNLVSAVNEVDAETTELKQDLGDIADLTTATKTDVVSAINEVSNACAIFETIENTSIASFTDGGLNLPVYELQVGIEPVQSGSGDPAPDNIRPISGFSTVNVNVTGKNIFDESTLYHGYFTSSSVDALSASEKYRTVLIDYLPAGTYTFSTTLPNNNCVIVRYYKDGVIAGSSTGANTFTFTTTTSGKFGLVFRKYDNTDITESITVQVEVGSSATDYEAYQGTTYPISLGSTYYGGTLNVTTGVLTVDMAMVDLGTLTWAYSNGYFYTDAVTDFIKTTTGSEVPNWYCSALKVVSYNNRGSGVPLIHTNTNSSYIFVRGTGYTDRDTFVTAMSGVQFVYEISTPTTVQLTPTQVYTLLKDNNIFADSGDVIKLVYRADLATYIQNLVNA